MPLKFVDQYTREEVAAQRAVLYVFGDNFERRGRGGQASAARGEPNAVGIPTKRRPSTEEDAYLTDADYDEWERAAANAYVKIEQHLASGGVVVWPVGLGMGQAYLQGRAPRILNEINAWAWGWRDRFRNV